MIALPLVVSSELSYKTPALTNRMELTFWLSEFKL